MTKHEKIAKEYGDHWDKVKDSCDENGWITPCGLVIDNIDVNFSLGARVEKWRIASLRGIENNHGWVLTSDYTPDKPGEYLVCIHGKKTSEPVMFDTIDSSRKAFINLFSHWRKIPVIPDPLY